MPTYFLDSFSGSLGDLPPKKRTIEDALRTLRKDPRVSCFERGAGWLEDLIDQLKSRGLIVERDGTDYPWCAFDLTPAGLAMIGGS